MENEDIWLWPIKVFVYSCFAVIFFILMLIGFAEIDNKHNFYKKDAGARPHTTQIIDRYDTIKRIK